MNNEILRWLNAIAAIFFFGLFSSSAQAALTYNYVGGLFPIPTGYMYLPANPINIVGTVTFKNISDPNFSGEISGGGDGPAIDPATGQWLPIVNNDLSDLEYTITGIHQPYSMWERDSFSQGSSLRSYDFVFVDGKITQWMVGMATGKYTGLGSRSPSTGRGYYDGFTTNLWIEDLTTGEFSYSALAGESTTSPGAWTQVSPVPLPASGLMLGASLLCSIGIAQRKRKPL